MKIERLDDTDVQGEAIRAQLDAVFAAAGAETRPCGSTCRKTCAKCGSDSCRCTCSCDCPDIVYALSSDPVNYPLDADIANLVFALRRLDVYRPCWSSAGRLATDGTIWKLPRVWFYCRSVLHVRLLADSVTELYRRDMLRVPWQVVVTFSAASNPDTIFSLEPKADVGIPASLAALHKDVAVIGGNLQALITGRARVLSQKT